MNKIKKNIKYLEVRGMGMSHIHEYNDCLPEGVKIIERKKVIPYYNREVLYSMRLRIKEKEKFINVGGFEVEDKTKKEPVEYVGMKDNTARKKITKDLQKKHGQLKVFFRSLP